MCYRDDRCLRVFGKWCCVYYVVVLWMSCNAAGDRASRTKRENLMELQNYLSEFGYLEKPKDGAFALRTETSVYGSLRRLQAFAGLPVTGQLDDATRNLMRRPRCGLPDEPRAVAEMDAEEGRHRHRRRRFAIYGQKWPYTSLTWSVRSKNLENLDHYQVRYVISKALEVWSKHSQLTFKEVDSDNADILIYFYRREHGDNFPFDGRGVVLAHAFFPTGMRSSIEVHFDADEAWTTDGSSDEGTNLFNVAAHEIGHSLGLSHSNVESALMYPWYKEMDNGFDFELPEDDKQAIQHLYGARDDRRQWGRIPEYYPPMTTPSTTTTTSTTTRPTTTTSRPRIYYTRRPVPYDPRYPQGKRPYSPTQKTYYPQKPMHPDKKPHYPRPGGTYPYGPDKKHPYHKHTPDTTPGGSEPHHPHHHTPDRRFPDHHQPEKSPDTHHPERVPPTRARPSSNPDKYPPGKDHPHHGPPKESPLPPPETCDTSYDAVAVIRREVFIFKDAYFWRIDESGLMPGYPAEIKRFWHGLPMNLTHVDAVYERPDGRIVFFIDDNYYVFYNNRVERGYPKKLTNLGLPNDLDKIDGAMVWGHNGKTYFYSGNLYWKFDEEIQKVELDYPRKITKSWKGVGRDIDAVFQWKDGKTYFFKGKGFWKFNDLFMRVDHEEPRPSAPFWMGCTPNIEEGQKLPYKEATSKASYTTFSLSIIVISVCHTIIQMIS